MNTEKMLLPTNTCVVNFHVIWPSSTIIDAVFATHIPGNISTSRWYHIPGVISSTNTTARTTLTTTTSAAAAATTTGLYCYSYFYDYAGCIPRQGGW